VSSAVTGFFVESYTGMFESFRMRWSCSATLKWFATGLEKHIPLGILSRAEHPRSILKQRLGVCEVAPVNLIIYPHGDEASSGGYRSSCTGSIRGYQAVRHRDDPCQADTEKPERKAGSPASIPTGHHVCRTALL
jgi:hypothetical protein